MKKAVLLIISVILIVCIALGIIYAIDMNRMKNNKPVFFSTWGYQYVPPEERDVTDTDITETDNQTEITYDENKFYKAAIKEFYYNKILPDGSKIDYFDDYDFSENKYAIYDVDSDGKNELIIQYVSGATASHFEVVYDFDNTKNTVTEQFRGCPLITYYSNGIIEEGLSHNQGLAGDTFWPYNMYEYDKDRDEYFHVGFVDAWDKSYREVNYENEAFPDEIDRDKDGFIYYMSIHSKEDVTIAADAEEYNSWRDRYITADTVKLDIPYINFTEENIVNNKAIYNEGEDYISLNIPEDWKFEIVPEFSNDMYRGGIKVYPEDSENCMEVYCANWFGVCGTGLKVEKAILDNGVEMTIGYYNSNPNWEYAHIEDNDVKIAVLNKGLEGEDANTAIEILKSIK